MYAKQGTLSYLPYNNPSSSVSLLPRCEASLRLCHAAYFTAASSNCDKKKRLLFMGRQRLAFQWPKELVLISTTDFSTINFSIRIPPVAMTLVFGHKKVYFYSLAVVCTFCIVVRNVSPMQKPCLAGFATLSRWGFVRSTRLYLSSALLLFLHSAS